MRPVFSIVPRDKIMRDCLCVCVGGGGGAVFFWAGLKKEMKNNKLYKVIEGN